MRLALLALVSCGLAIGCSPSRETGNTAPEERAITPLEESALRHEELIAACMGAAGFDYVAVIPNDVLLEQARAEGEARGLDVEAATASVSLPPDPNAAIVANLDDEERAAYDLAFWGLNDVDGCYYNTYEEAWGVDVLDLADQLADRLDDVEDRIAADPAVIAAKDEFVSCVSAEGYEVETFYDLTSYNWRRESEVAEAIFATGATDVRSDDPLWEAYVQEMEGFNATYTRCEERYLAVVAPIENSYLGNDG